MPAPKKPQDRQAKADARGDALTVEFRGRTYTISREQADNVEVLEMIEDEKYITAIRSYLGAEQWADLKDAMRGPNGVIPASVFQEFTDVAMAAIGGNSPASPAS